MSTSIPNNYSYEFQNKVRDLSNVFDQLRVSFPTFLSLIPNGQAATNNKVEWLEDGLSPTQSTITSFDTDGDGTGINLVSTAGISAGSILRFATSADITRTELVKVASVDSATDLTVVRDYGGSTGVTLVVGDKVFLVSSPRNEKTNPSFSSGQEPGVVFNYTEIFDRAVSIGRTAIQTNIYGLTDLVNYNVRNKMIELMYEMNSAVIYGRKVQRTASENGTLGGVLQFLEGGNIDTTGGAVSPTILNNMLQSIFRDGAFSNNYVILCADNQARKISAFNTAGNNPMIQKPYSPMGDTFGGYVSQFIGDLPAQTGFQAKIVVDPNFARDQVAIIDMNRIELRAMQALKDMDATTPGMDGVARRMLGEYTLVVKNGQQAHALATGLTV